MHGAGSDRTGWQLQTRWFAHHVYRAAAVDLPGHGGSDGPALRTITDMADWLATAIAAMDLAPAHVVGHSMGTFVALETAARHPEVTRSLVLLGTAAAMPVQSSAAAVLLRARSAAWRAWAMLMAGNFPSALCCLTPVLDR